MRGGNRNDHRLTPEIRPKPEACMEACTTNPLWHIAFAGLQALQTYFRKYEYRDKNPVGNWRGCYEVCKPAKEVTAA